MYGTPAAIRMFTFVFTLKNIKSRKNKVDIALARDIKLCPGKISIFDSNLKEKMSNEKNSYAWKKKSSPQPYYNSFFLHFFVQQNCKEKMAKVY